MVAPRGNRVRTPPGVSLAVPARGGIPTARGPGVRGAAARDPDGHPAQFSGGPAGDGSQHRRDRGPGGHRLVGTGGRRGRRPGAVRGVGLAVAYEFFPPSRLWESGKLEEFSKVAERPTFPLPPSPADAEAGRPVVARPGRLPGNVTGAVRPAPGPLVFVRPGELRKAERADYLDRLKTGKEIDANTLASEPTDTPAFRRS